MHRSAGMRHVTTPPFLDETGAERPGSIAEVRRLKLGGVEQWVMLRGERLANPPLLLLHGGPGFTETTFFRHGLTPLERFFTLVYWDQRGAGRSFTPGIPPQSMTVAQFVSDLGELVDFVRARTGHQKVVLLGHSWGSGLGVLYAAQHPEKVSAYVGSGQYGDAAAAESASYRYALAEAERRGNSKALRKLRALGPPPYPAASVFAERTWISRLTGAMRPRELWKLVRMILAQPEASLLEVPSVYRAFRWTMDRMWREASSLNLFERAPRLEVPVFFFLGRQDHWVPPETSVAYFEKLIAPSKELVFFERSGHEPFVDEPERFNAAMLERVLPIALKTESARDAPPRTSASPIGESAAAPG